MELHQKNKISGVGSELKVTVDGGVERLKVISSWEDGQGKRVSNFLRQTHFLGFGNSQSNYES